MLTEVIIDVNLNEFDVDDSDDSLVGEHEDVFEDIEVTQVDDQKPNFRDYFLIRLR